MVGVAGVGAQVSFSGRRRTKSPGILPSESTTIGTAGAAVGGRCQCVRWRWWAEAEGVCRVEQREKMGGSENANEKAEPFNVNANEKMGERKARIGIPDNGEKIAHKFFFKS